MNVPTFSVSGVSFVAAAVIVIIVVVIVIIVIIVVIAAVIEGRTVGEGIAIFSLFDLDGKEYIV